MANLFIYLAAIACGFIFLTLSADRLIEVSSTLAFRLGMSVLTIGMTIVAFGTSAPELLVSAVAAYNGSGGISIGNALGSNTINIGLVLGAVGLMVPIIVSPRILYRELPILGLVIALVIALLADGMLSNLDGLLLLSVLAIYCIYLTRGKSKESDDSNNEEVVILPISTTRAWLEAVAMLIILLASSQILVWGASGLARQMGVSELVIGLTVIAFGTSLPELAAAIASAKKGLHDMVLATVIGSNIFNLLGVMAFPALIGKGIEVSHQVLVRDTLAMAALTALLAVIAYSSIRKPPARINPNGSASLSTAICCIPKYKSLLLLIGFIAYMGCLFATAGH